MGVSTRLKKGTIPIKFIWNLVQQRVSEKNIEQLESKIKSLILEALASITPGAWKKETNHVKRLEEEYRITGKSLIIDTADTSESYTTDSETNSDFDDIMSGIGELV